MSRTARTGSKLKSRTCEEVISNLFQVDLFFNHRNIDGRFEFDFTPTKTGVMQFRIVTESELGFIGSASEFASVLVR
jgi:hypothetical protein